LNRHLVRRRGPFHASEIKKGNVIMIRKFPTTAAMLALTVGVADAATFMPNTPATDARASAMIGQAVYSSDGKDTETGEIQDLLVGENGTIDAVVIGVGGFLGIAEKAVAASFKDVKWAAMPTATASWGWRRPRRSSIRRPSSSMPKCRRRTSPAPSSTMRRQQCRQDQRRHCCRVEGTWDLGGCANTAVLGCRRAQGA
jgi:hypothetical protein